MQFDRPDVGEGFVEIFRRSRSAYEAARIKQEGLDPAAQYTFLNLDDTRGHELSPKEVMEKGIAVQLKRAPDSALMTYKRAPQMVN